MKQYSMSYIFNLIQFIYELKDYVGYPFILIQIVEKKMLWKLKNESVNNIKISNFQLLHY